MSELHDDLRSTEESVRRDAERIKVLEEKKSSLDPADDRVPELSEQVERVSNGLREKSTAEREIADRLRSGE